MNKLFIIVGAIMIFVALSLPALTQMAQVTHTYPVPEGYFTLNGEKATTTSTHSVTDPVLNFEFIATANGEYAYNVKVYLYNEGATDTIDWASKYPTGDAAYVIVLEETDADSKWTGWGELPYTGTFEVWGEFMDMEGNNHRVMSIVGAWTGSEGTFDGQPIELPLQLQFAQLGLGIIGAVLVFVGLITGDRRKRW